MKNILYLGSKSETRHQLLREAQIDFVVIDQEADESTCGLCSSLRETVENIALHKMEHVILPEGCEGDICFVLTADTLTQHPDGSLGGKPKDRYSAIEMIKSTRGIATGGSAFCLDKRVWRKNCWTIFKRINGYAQAKYEIGIPDEWIDFYLKKSLGDVCAGAIAIKEFGAQFVKNIRGSHSAIIGLPMFELRQALQELGFFKLG